MSKMTFKYTASFDLTTIVDVAEVTGMVADMRSELLSCENPTQKALMGLVVQAYDRSPEEGFAELIRTATRVGLNEILKAELATNTPELTYRPSPVKVVCHGIEI